MTRPRRDLQSPTSQGTSDSPNLEALDGATAVSQSPPAAPSRGQSPSRSGVQPGFKLLIGLTLVTALLLAPFAFSEAYFDLLRANSVDLHDFLRGELYKQGTGFAALGLVLLEVLLTARKRGRGWLVKIKLPGSMMLWRSIHIFLGVGLVGMVLIHTLGANGLNFNAVFLWVFFATTLTALVGVVAETGILESSRSSFGPVPGSGTMVSKGSLIRGLRGIWLISHIFFVCMFGVMLVFHIALAYYYQ